MEREILKSTYFYDLPESLIAQTPIEPRDHSRMLVYDRKKKEIKHKKFYDILSFLTQGDVLVLNTTKVLPARLIGFKDTGAKIEILLQKRKSLVEWEVLAKPVKRLKLGTEIVFSDKLKCVVEEIGEYGYCRVKFDFEGTFEHRISEVGTMPLPPYIREKLKDQQRYQTIYADKGESSAAPTAGLHFTNELLKKIKEVGVKIVSVNLNVGLGTFRPVSEENILNHKMHSEFFEISQESADIINYAKKEGRRVIAVGTTSVRVVESAYSQGKVHACKKSTDIFIYPGKKFNVIDGLITNFHLPESTLIMLVAAFLGVEETLKIYKTAVDENYRFFSFGDACLFL